MVEQTQRSMKKEKEDFEFGNLYFLQSQELNLSARLVVLLYRLL